MTSVPPAMHPARLAAWLDRLAHHHDETCRHCGRVGRLAASLTRIAGADEALEAAILSAATLHDIGKLGIPAALLDHPLQLTEAERERFQRHTDDGAALLAAEPGGELAVIVAQSHHERWDGSGYPHGLSGAAIPLAARLTSIADVYDALRAPRAYKEGRTHPRVMATMAHMQQQFDPQLLAIFLEAEAEVERLFASMTVAG